MASSEKFSDSKLLAAWKKAGRPEREFMERRPVGLDDYEEHKLGAAGVNLDSSREFFMRLKALMGQTEFATLCGDVAERQQTIDSRNGKFSGLKPKNPTAVVIGLGLHRLSELKEGSLALFPSPFPVANPPAPAIPAKIAPAVRTPKSLSPAKAPPSSRTASGITPFSEETTTIGFSARALVACNLPHTDPGDVPYWSKSNGQFRLLITPGKVPNQTGGGYTSLGIPYGTMPRLIAIFLATEAIRTKTREISIGDSFNEFIRRLGIEKSGPTKRMVQEQLMRLVNADIRFNRVPPAGVKGAAFEIASLAAGAQLWWDTRADDQVSLFQNYIRLNAEFYAEVTNHGFPVDLRTIADLRKSPLALDLYGWFAYRVATLRKPLHLSNEVLQEQLGTSYKYGKDFAVESRAAVQRIKRTWPKLACEAYRGGLILSPCDTPIPPDRPTLA